MQKIEISEIRELCDYEKIRNDYRKKIIEIKKNRRIQIGNRMSLLFENRETVLFQIHEMIRIERIVDIEKIKNEIEVYNNLIPDENELSASLFIEISDPKIASQALHSLKGIEDDCVSIKIGNKHIIPAVFSEKRIDRIGLSAIQYIKFKFAPDQKETFIYGDDIVFISVNHPNYQFYTALDDEIKACLYTDFLT